MGRRAAFAFWLALLVPVASASATSGPEGALDNRAWEMVSPADKNGGEVELPGGEGAGFFGAAASGGAFAFGSEASLGTAAGAGPVSQYLAGRSGGGWSTANLTPPQLSGTYSGGAYQLFSADLSRGLLSSGWRCRDGGSKCAAENPPLSSDAPADYRNLYLREGSTYIPLLTTANLPPGPVAPEDFELSLEGASENLRHIVISVAQSLYQWSEGQLTLIDPSPSAALAAPAGAISTDGARVYWTGAGGNLHLHEGAHTAQVDTVAGGGGEFQTASGTGSVAFFTKAGHLYRFLAATETATDLTPGGEVQGVLGASADGSYLYYLASAGLQLWHEGATVKVAAGADLTNFPPASGTARVSADGTRLAFVSSASLTGYANVGKTEVFVYDAVAKKLFCASCNPRGSTPAGPSSIPGAIAAGDGPAAYKPRALSADGRRLFFDSADSLVLPDTDKAPDVYEWEALGTGGCAKAGGCIGLLSSGRAGSASLLDASADGTDVFFLTNASLSPADPGSLDVYDARAGGGFPEAPAAIPCEGDDCQGPAPAPEDPTPGTALFQGPVNPPVRFPKTHHPKKLRHKKHHRHGAKHDSRPAKGQRR